MKQVNKKKYYFSVIIKKDESDYYVAKVPSLKSCYTQAKSLSELYKRLNEVISLCLDAEKIFLKQKQNSQQGSCFLFI